MPLMLELIVLCEKQGYATILFKSSGPTFHSLLRSWLDSPSEIVKSWEVASWSYAIWHSPSLRRKVAMDVVSGLALNTARPVHVRRLYAWIPQVMRALACCHISNIVSYHGPGSRALLGVDFPMHVTILTGRGGFNLQFFPLAFLHINH